MDIICVDKPSTFPALIREVIIKKRSTFNSYFLKAKVHSDAGVRCALEYHYMYTDYDLTELLSQVLMILDDYLFEGYHNTRVIRKSTLIENGLLLLSADPYVNQIRSVMTDLGIDESAQDGVCSKVREYLDNEHGNRTGMLSFFAPYGLSQDYWKFTKNIGGEVCEFGLSDTFPDVYNILASNGYPVTVRFAYYFRDVANYRKDTIAFEFIRHYAAKLILDYDYPINFDAVLTKPVEPQNILEIIDFVDK